jgi:hypothetical protein
MVSKVEFKLYLAVSFPHANKIGHDHSRSFSVLHS